MGKATAPTIIRVDPAAGARGFCTQRLIALKQAVREYLAADDALNEALRRTGWGGMGNPIASEAKQRAIANIRNEARRKLDEML